MRNIIARFHTHYNVFPPSRSTSKSFNLMSLRNTWQSYSWIAFIECRPGQPMLISVLRGWDTVLQGFSDVVTSQIAKFMGPTWRPPGSCRPQMGPMLAPWTLLSWITSKLRSTKAVPKSNSSVFHVVVRWGLFLNTCMGDLCLIAVRLNSLIPLWSTSPRLQCAPHSFDHIFKLVRKSLSLTYPWITYCRRKRKLEKFTFGLLGWSHRITSVLLPRVFILSDKAWFRRLPSRSWYPPCRPCGETRSAPGRLKYVHHFCSDLTPSHPRASAKKNDQ